MPEVFVSDIHVGTDNYRLAIHTKTQDIAFHYCTCKVTHAVYALEHVTFCYTCVAHDGT